jgi:hypothetical protein
MSSSQSQNSLFRQQQHLYRSAHYLAKSKLPTLYTPPPSSSHDGSTKGKKKKRDAAYHSFNYILFSSLSLLYIGRKRRASYEDEEMTNSEAIDFKPPVQQQIQQREAHILHTTKRNRMSLKKEFPISKLLGKWSIAYEKNGAIN